MINSTRTKNNLTVFAQKCWNPSLKRQKTPQKDKNLAECFYCNLFPFTAPNILIKHWKTKVFAHLMSLGTAHEDRYGLNGPTPYVTHQIRYLFQWLMKSSWSVYHQTKNYKMTEILLITIYSPLWAKCSLFHIKMKYSILLERKGLLVYTYWCINKRQSCRVVRSVMCSK